MLCTLSEILTADYNWLGLMAFFIIVGLPYFYHKQMNKNCVLFQLNVSLTTF